VGSPQLDVRNVLWLLAAMIFVVGPHLFRMPNWLGIFFLAVVAWRAWISWYALRSPPRPLMWAITLLALVGVWVGFGRIVGREGGVALLILMAALKLLEMRNERDVILSIYLGFFLVLTNFLFSQSIPLGLYMIVCVWIFVATLVGFNRVGRSPTLKERLRPAAALLLQAMPLMVAFFILFPRTTGPLWALPTDQRTGQTGLSDTMTPGNIANLIKSESIAFRAAFEDGLPPYRTLYWRGPVMVDFDGSTWKMRNYVSGGRTDHPRREQAVRYTVNLEPTGKNWLFALDVPGSIPAGATLLSDMQMRYRRPLTERLRYDMTSYLDYRFGLGANKVQLEAALKFDEARNPRTVALGRQWAAENPDPRAVLSKAAVLYNSGTFAYTLEPPLLNRQDPFDDFLFNSKQGFCEHYAGSFTLLMRAAGVPARVVTGYQGGEVNPLNGELIVRQADAHAWSEIWVADQGWVRIDPTASVSPMRVENGVNAAMGPIGILPALIQGRSHRADRQHALRVARDEQPVGRVGRGLQPRPPAPVLHQPGLPVGRLEHARLLARGRDHRRGHRGIHRLAVARAPAAARGLAPRLEPVLRQDGLGGARARPAGRAARLPRAPHQRTAGAGRTCAGDHAALHRRALRQRRLAR
jgi:transglutaminase-like putative cysteine protease